MGSFVHIGSTLRWSIFLFTGAFSIPARADTTRVLFIGNSYTYTNDLPGMFRTLSASLGETVETGMSAPGGYTFALHTTNATTQTNIAQGDWDFVVVQEQSQLPSFSPGQVENEVFPFAMQLVQQVNAANACAEVVFLMTWGRENGDASNCASYPPVCTYAGMQQRLRDSYVQMAMDNSSWCAPVGAVWRSFRTASNSGLYTDGSHPNVTGTYIAASTLFSTIFRRSCESSDFEPSPILASDAALARTLASTVVADSASTWNIGINDPVSLFTYSELGSGSYQFNNTSEDATSFSWSFGDGSTSFEPDPLHVYSSIGAYVITLVSIDECGRTDTAALDLSVLSTGIQEVAGAHMVEVTIDPIHGLAMVKSTGPNGRFEIVDQGGRILFSLQLTTSTRAVELPHSMHGAFLWRYMVPGTSHRTGRFVLP